MHGITTRHTRPRVHIDPGLPFHGTLTARVRGHAMVETRAFPFMVPPGHPVPYLLVFPTRCDISSGLSNSYASLGSFLCGGRHAVSVSWLGRIVPSGAIPSDRCAQCHRRPRNTDTGIPVRHKSMNEEVCWDRRASSRPV